MESNNSLQILLYHRDACILFRREKNRHVLFLAGQYKQYRQPFSLTFRNSELVLGKDLQGALIIRTKRGIFVDF